MAENDPDPVPVFKPPNPVRESQKSPLEPVIPDLPAPLTGRNPPGGVYFLEIMKNGTIIGRMEIKENRLSFGRSRDADVPLDHPSISRYHAVILWKDMEQSDRGYFYLMDLNSTHGTVLNKKKVTSGTIVKIPIGNNVIKFGGSTRSFMLNSVMSEDGGEGEEESAVSESETGCSLRESETGCSWREPETGCSWGMREDAKDEDEGKEDEEAFMDKFTNLLNTPSNEVSPNEHAFSQHPQRSLQIWFDQEGYDFDFQVLPDGSNFKATIQLPVEGRDVAIEGPSQSKKKDAITQLCLKVCRLLDRAERLFPWQHQNAHKRSRAEIEEDEEEDLYDETEQGKMKRAKKLLQQKVKERQDGAETYESLRSKYEQWSRELGLVEDQLKVISAGIRGKKSDGEEKTNEEEEKNNEEVDSLEMFMKQELIDDSNRMEVKIEKSRLKMKVKELQRKITNCEKLMKIACPTHIPSFNPQSTGSRVPSFNPQSTGSGIPSLNPQSTGSRQKCVGGIDVRSPSSVKQPRDEGITDKDACGEGVNPAQGSSRFTMKITPRGLTSKLFVQDSTPESMKNERTRDESTEDGSTKDGRTRSDVTETGSTKCTETKGKKTAQVNLGVGVSLTEMKHKAIIASDEGHEDFVDWIPPKNQDGSGKTSLNEKFGY